MPDDVVVLALDQFQERIGRECNPFLTVLSTKAGDNEDLAFSVTSMPNGGPHNRVLSAIDYLKHLRDVAVSGKIDIADDTAFLFQGEDMPVDIASISWETMADWNNVAIIPDLYYFHARGYEDVPPSSVRWTERDPVVIWRGSTTGRFYQPAEELDLLPRYQLCKRAARLGVVADMGITAAVQAADPRNEQLIGERLTCEGLFKPFIPMSEMARNRYILDIDGNSNSWNFMAKLRLGCCVLRVDSDWRQWFSSRLVPWVHYVPIAKNLSDLEDRIDWCLANEAESAAIAERGTAFAYAMSFQDEMAAAAMTAYGTRRIM